MTRVWGDGHDNAPFLSLLPFAYNTRTRTDDEGAWGRHDDATMPSPPPSPPICLQRADADGRRWRRPHQTTTRVQGDSHDDVTTPSPSPSPPIRLQRADADGRRRRRPHQTRTRTWGQMTTTRVRGDDDETTTTMLSPSLPSHSPTTRGRGQTATATPPPDEDESVGSDDDDEGTGGQRRDDDDNALSPPICLQRADTDRRQRDNDDALSPSHSPTTHGRGRTTTVTSPPDDDDASVGQVSRGRQRRRHRGGTTRAWGTDDDEEVWGDGHDNDDVCGWASLPSEPPTSRSHSLILASGCDADVTSTTRT